jgi:F-type H+-transporting ATPase subunit alpha
VDQLREFEAELYKFVDTFHPKLGPAIMEKKTIDDALKAEMQQAIKDFKERFVSERQPAGAGAATGA